MQNLVLAFALIGVLGVGAQWAAWRFSLPAIVVMAIAGLIAGPVTGLLWPAGYDPSTADAPPMEALFGDFYRPMIGIAVAVILFEGGLTLNLAELRGISAAVRRLIFPGAFVAWTLGAAAARYVGGLAWETAILFAGVMVVTGPTVIAPLLRQSKLNSRPAALLKWEGIVNDPLGALLAVLAYEVAVLDVGVAHEGAPAQIVASLVLAALLDAGFGFVLGKAIAMLFRRGWTAEYLKPPILLVAVLVCFEIANLLQEEGGLVAVTVMGMTLANSRVASINELRLFKENVAVLLISGVFVILTANLTWQNFAALDARAYLFLAAMLFVVRPATVFLSTIGADLPWRERLLVGWIAPRGIVAVAVTSFFGASLASGISTSLEAAADPAAREALAYSLASAEKMIPLAFAMVFATVVLHGFTISPLAKLLGLASSERPGVLISGSSLWSAALAKALADADVPVLVADASWRRLRPAREAGLQTYYGELLSEVTEHHLELNRYGVLLAVGGNEAHNALVCTDLAPEMGRAAIYQVNARGKDDDNRRALSYTLQGRTLLKSAAPLDQLMNRHFAGWRFRKATLSEEFTPEAYQKSLAKDAETVAIIRRGNVLIESPEAPLRPAVGDVVIYYSPPSDADDDKPETPPQTEAEERLRQEVEAEGETAAPAPTL